MVLVIRVQRALLLARQLAAKKSVTMSAAVMMALESAMARESRPLYERIADIARDASRLSRGRRSRVVREREIDDLWGN